MSCFLELCLLSLGMCLQQPELCPFPGLLSKAWGAPGRACVQPTSSVSYLLASGVGRHSYLLSISDVDTWQETEPLQMLRASFTTDSFYSLSFFCRLFLDRALCSLGVWSWTFYALPSEFMGSAWDFRCTLRCQALLYLFTWSMHRASTMPGARTGVWLWALYLIAVWTLAWPGSSQVKGEGWHVFPKDTFSSQVLWWEKGSEMRERGSLQLKEGSNTYLYDPSCVCPWSHPHLCVYLAFPLICCVILGKQTTLLLHFLTIYWQGQQHLQSYFSFRVKSVYFQSFWHQIGS